MWIETIRESASSGKAVAVYSQRVLSLIDSAPWDESSSVDKQPITPESVAAVILNWNGGLLLRRCLQALRLARPRPGRIYVADNGSEDGTPQLVRNEGDMTLVEN